MSFPGHACFFLDEDRVLYEMVPPPEDLARFLSACTGNSVALVNAKRKGTSAFESALRAQWVSCCNFGMDWNINSKKTDFVFLDTPQEATFGHTTHLPTDKEGLNAYIRKHLIRRFKEKNVENSATGTNGVPLEIQ